MACCTVELTKSFNRLARNEPDLARGQKPLGKGKNAIVVADLATDVLTKIVFRPKSRSWREKSQKWFENEVSVLRCFTESPLETVNTPLLIGEPEVIDRGKYYGSFQMTRINGRQVCHTARTESEHRMFEHMHRGAGRLLARFHAEVAQKPLDIPNCNDRYPAHLVVSRVLPDTFNRAMEILFGYVQDNAKPGVVHNDFHSGNILFDGNGNAAGIIDFSAMCHSTNLYQDFMCVSDCFLPSFVKGYEEESTQTVDRALLDATRLCHCASYIDKLIDDPREFSLTLMSINQRLTKLADVTGFRPQI